MLIATLGATLTFFGCQKDYTDDINKVREDLTAALEEQNQALTNEINSLREEARQYAEDAQAAAEAYADAAAAAAKAEAIEEAERLAQEALDAAKEYADDAAAKAAADAKAEVLKEIQEDLEQTLADAKSYTDAEIKALKAELEQKIQELSSRIEGVAEELNTLKGTVEKQGDQINDLIAMDAKLDARLKALEDYKATVEDFIKSTTEELKDLSDKLAALDTKHDEDIAKLREEIDGYVAELQEQIDTINNTILEIQGTIVEIQGQIKDLYTQVANTNLELEGLATYILMYEEQMKETLANLESELRAAIEAGDNAVKEELISKLNAAIDGLRAELKEYFNTELSELENQFNESMEEVKADLQAKYDELKGEISALNEKVDRIEAEIYEYINSALVGLEEKIGDRLTSISLIPETYVNGVPSIMIPVMQYNEWIAGNVAEVYTKDIQNTYYSAIDTVIVRYHLSPDHIDMNGIDGISYLFESAEIVKGYMDDPQWFTIDENKARINDRNELEVPLKRDYVAIGQGERYDLHTIDATEIVTAALKVGIAEELFMEGETDACVTSEYSAIYDDVFGIHITPLFDLAQDIDGFACVNGNHKRFSTTFAAAQGAEVSQQVLYNGQLDLLSMVTSCIARQTGNGVKEISKESLRDYGYAFRFELPAEFHKGTEETNEQDFIYFVDNNKTVVASKLPDGTQNNKAAVGRTPIVRAMLMDTVNNHIIDVQWFKLEWVNEIMPAEEIDLGTIKEFDYLLNCNGFEGQVTWQEFNNLVIGKIGESGMTHEDFGYYYVNSNSLSYEIELDETAENFNNAIGTITINWPAAEVPQTTTILKWHLTVAEIGNIIDELLADEDGTISKTVIVTVNPQPDRVAPILKFRFKVNVSVEDLPEIFGYNNPRWEDAGHTSAKINPIAFKDASPESGDYDFTECVYYADIFDLFTSDENGNIVTNLYMSEDQIAKYEASNAFDCRRWDMQFSAVQANAPEGYTYVPEFAYNDPTALYAPDESEEGYGLITTAGLDFPWITMTQQWTQHGQDNWYRTEAGEVIEAYFIQTAQGTPYDESLIALANDEDASVAIDIWARINQFNVVKVKTFDISFVNPLTIAAPKTNASITDEYNVTQTVALDSYLGQVTDFAGERVDNDEDAAEYYGLEYTWGDLSTVRINMRYDGNDIIVDSSLDPADPEDYAKMLTLEEAKLNYATLEEDGGKTTFTYTRTNAQLSLKEPAVIYIPVSYTHFWGEAQFYLPIQVKVGKL